MPRFLMFLLLVQLVTLFRHVSTQVSHRISTDWLKSVTDQHISSPHNVLGSDIYLKCPIENAPRIKWTRENGGLPVGAVQQGRTLRLPNFSRRDEGTYICSADKDGYQHRGYVAAQMEYTMDSHRSQIWPPSRVQVYASQHRLWPGDDVTLTCLVEGINNPNSIPYWWEKVEGTLATNVKVLGNQLTITSLRRENEGFYRCTVDNKGRIPANSVFQMKVQIPPEPNYYTTPRPAPYYHPTTPYYYHTTPYYYHTTPPPPPRYYDRRESLPVNRYENQVRMGLMEPPRRVGSWFYSGNPTLQRKQS